MNDYKSKILHLTYDDLLKKSLSNIGDGLAGLTKVLVLPLNLIGTTAIELEKKYDNLITSAINKVPKHKQQKPDPKILATILENVKYNFESPEILDLFEKLLIASMNKDAASLVHPSFIEIVNQMSPLDARLMKEYFKNNDSVYINEITWDYEDIYTYLSVDSLQRFGLVLLSRNIHETFERISLTTMGKIFREIVFLDIDSISPIVTFNKDYSETELKEYEYETAMNLQFNIEFSYANTYNNIDIFSVTSTPAEKNKVISIPSVLVRIFNQEKNEITIDNIFILHSDGTKIMSYDFTCPTIIPSRGFHNFLFLLDNEKLKTMYKLRANPSIIIVNIGDIKYDLEISNEIYYGISSYINKEE